MSRFAALMAIIFDVRQRGGALAASLSSRLEVESATIERVARRLDAGLSLTASSGAGQDEGCPALGQAYQAKYGVAVACQK